MAAKTVSDWRNKRIVAFLIRHVLWAVFLLSMPFLAKAAEQNLIYIVSSRSVESFQSELVNFAQSLRAVDTKLDVVLVNAQGNLPVFGDNTAAVITTGTEAATAIVAAHIDFPILHLFITQGSMEKLYPDQIPKNVHSILLDQPFSRYLDAVKTYFPHAAGVSMLYGPVSVKRKLEHETLIKQKGLVAKSIVLDEDDNASRAIDTLIDYAYPIIAIPDAVALPPNNSKWLLYSSYHKRIPVVAYSNAFLTAGATVAVYSTPTHIFQQALETVKKTLLQKEYGKDQKAFPLYFDVVVNKRVAESLSLTLPRGAKVLE